MALTEDVLSRVIAFANGKGGAGKTSTSCNFAGLCAAAGWKTLFLEFDPQGNAGHDLGYGWEGRSDDGAHMLAVLDEHRPLEPVLRDVRPGLDVVPMGRDALMNIEDVLHGKIRRGTEFRTLLAEAIAPVAKDYDVIVIDTPPTRPIVLRMVLGATRWLVVPTKSDRSSIMGLSELAAELAQVRPVNPVVAILGAVLFDIDSQATRIRRNAVADINAALDGAAPLLESTIRHSSAGIDARNEGLLVHELAQVERRRSERIPVSVDGLAHDHLMLTQEILERIATAEESAA